MKLSIILLALLAFMRVEAADLSVSLNKSDVKIEKASLSIFSNVVNPMIKGFSKVSVEGFESYKELGAPELPVKSVLLKGQPADIQVQIRNAEGYAIQDLKPTPVQEQDCRCETQKQKTFQYDAKLYKEQKPYKLTYLGAFRGEHVTRLDLYVAKYSAKDNSVFVNTSMKVKTNVDEFSFEGGDYRDYLVITTENLKSGIDSFSSWKKSQGYNVTVEVVSNPTLESVGSLVKEHYEAGVDFVIILGDEKTIPMHHVSTSGDYYETPSDLKYFTMDGPDDYIPDMFYSRIVASNPEQVLAQLNKSLEFEQKSAQNLNGLKRVVGIASNEGYNPSDDQYVRAIGENFKSVLGVESIHFAEDDKVNSNPEGVNKALNEGAFWLTYMGHGSGTSWGNTNIPYTMNSVTKLRNRDAVKPVIIDVACMNGVIKSGFLGSKFLEVSSDSDAMGAVGYYGGTVNISWHPPAIMAQGIASEHLSKNFKHLGEALLAGQLYLAQKWSNSRDVIDNMEWYHLQGDPGMNIQF